MQSWHQRRTLSESFIFTIEVVASSHVLPSAHRSATSVVEATKNHSELKIQTSPDVHNSPIVLFLLGNVDSQRLRIIVQDDASIEAYSLLQLLNRFKFDIAEALELIRLLVLHQTHILHRQLAEDLNDIALHDALRQIPDERQERRLCGQWLLALMIVEPAVESKC